MITALLCCAILALAALTSPATAGQDQTGDDQTANQAADQSAQGDDASAQAPASPPNEKLLSPHDTLFTFLGAMGADSPDFKLGIACMDVSQTPQAEHEKLALYLYRCINRIEYVSINDRSIPDRTKVNANPSLNEWIFFPRTVSPARQTQQRAARTSRIESLAPDATIGMLKQPNGEWKFSQQTVAGIEAMWNAIADVPVVAGLTTNEYFTLSERIEAMWPDAMIVGSVLGVKYWQWATMLVLIIAGLVLDLLLRLILTRISNRLIARGGGKARPQTIRRMVRPFGLTAAALFWLSTIDVLGLQAEAQNVLLPAVKLFAMLATVWAGFRLIDLGAEYFESKAERTSTKFDDVLVPLVRKALKILVFVFGLIYIAGAFNVPLAPLIAGLSIGGAGFAFAAKDTLEHFFGSVTVIADRPFEVGDWVQIGDTEGTVEELGFRSTRVRTFYNSLVTVPNGNLVRAVIDNYGKRKYRRWSTHLNITYDTPPDKIDAFCEGVREIIRLHPYTRKDYYQVWLHKFGAHSLDILLYVFFEAPDWNTELRERHRLSLDIIRLADALGVEFAFPTQTLHVQKVDDDAGEHESMEAPDEDAQRRAEIIGRRAVRALTAHADWRDEKPGPYVFKHAEDFTGDPDADDATQIESTTGGDAG